MSLYPRNLLLIALVAVLACRPTEQRTDSIDPNAGARDRALMQPEVVAQLDSGSLAFRNDDYEAALVHYRSVTDLDPSIGAGWFGVYMAQRELGDLEAAEAALEQARRLIPGATLLHSDSTS